MKTSLAAASFEGEFSKFRNSLTSRIAYTNANKLTHDMTSVNRTLRSQIEGSLMMEIKQLIGNHELLVTEVMVTHGNGGYFSDFALYFSLKYFFLQYRNALVIVTLVCLHYLNSFILVKSFSFFQNKGNGGYALISTLQFKVRKKYFSFFYVLFQEYFGIYLIHIGKRGKSTKHNDRNLFPFYFYAATN